MTAHTFPPPFARAARRARLVLLAFLALGAWGSALAQGVLQALMAFEPAAIAGGETTVLRVTLDNTASETVTRGVGYEVVLPPGMRIVETPSGKQCNGRVRLEANGYSFRAKRLQPGLVCAVTVGVTVDSATARDIVLVVGPIRARNAVGVTQVSATLTVTGGTPPPGDGPRIVTVPPLAPQLTLLAPVAIVIDSIGGTHPYAYDIAAGALPPGLALSSDGRIAGAPTALGRYDFTVRVRDARGRQDLRAFTLDVARVPTSLRMTVAPNPAVEGQVVIVSATASSSGGAPDGGIQAWIAGESNRCPDPFESGSAPVTAITQTAPLAGGGASIPFSGLPVGNLRVCLLYAGNAAFAPSTQGPSDLYVIKGIVLSPP